LFQPFGVGLGLFALLLQLMLPLGLAVASEGGADASRFGLCLSDDGRRLFFGFDEPSGSSRSYDCPLCVWAKNIQTGFPSSDTVALTLPQSRFFHYASPVDISLSLEDIHQRPWIRGPPKS